MQIGSNPFRTTIEPDVAKQFAREVQELEELKGNRVNRVKFLSNSYNHVETTVDYVIVSSIADGVLEDTDLVIGELFNHDTWWSFVSMVTTAYLDTIKLRELFRVIDVDSSAHSLEVPVVSERKMASPMSKDESFPASSMGFETKSIESQRLRFGVTVGSSLSPKPTFVETLEQLCETIYSEIDAMLPDEIYQDSEDPMDAFFDAYHDIQAEMYRPDLAVIGTDVIDAIGDQLAKPNSANWDTPEATIAGVDCIESEWIPSSEIVLADTDYAGYEAVFSELEGEIDLSMQYTRDDPFDPIDISAVQGKSWDAIYDDAVARVRV